MTESYRILVFLFLIAAVLAGCGQPSYTVTGLAVERAGWDSVRVDAGFSRQNLLGPSTAVNPPSVTVVLLGSKSDTLYAGPSFSFLVPDASLGNREPLLVEVCGHFEGQEVCEQSGFLASPKRITAQQDIDYPQNGDMDRGEFVTAFVVERQIWESEEWEEIERGRDVTGFLLAYVDGHQDEGVRIPLGRQRGHFNLARLDNYRDFRYYLRSSLLERNEATVRFDLYAGLGGDEQVVVGDEKVIRKKAREIRELEAGFFVEQAADRLLDRLSAFFGPSRTYVYLDSWQFIEGERRYAIEMELVWSSSFFRQRWYRVAGVLQVLEDGSSAVFRRTRANDRGEERWDDRIDGEEVSLGVLEPRPQDDSSFAFGEPD